jgi:hypothetical protein
MNALEVLRKIENTQMKPKIIFLLGTEFCGSTAFGNILNNIYPGMYAGESSRLFYQNEFYISEKPCLICRPLGRKCETYENPSNHLDHTSSPSIFLSNLAKSNGLGVVIDGSKEPQYLLNEYAALSEIADVRVLIALRNPLRNVSSLLDLIPEQENWYLAFERWRDFYRNSLRIVNRLGIPSMTINTECFNPESIQDSNLGLKTLEKIFSFTLDESLIPSKVEISTAPTHQIGGNPGTQVGRSKKIENELRMNLNRKLINQLSLDCNGFLDLANWLGVDTSDYLSDCGHDETIKRMLHEWHAG